MPDTACLRAALDHFGRIPPQLDWCVAAHVHHDCHQLIVVLNGAIETQIRGTRIVGRRGDVLYYPKGVEHEERAVGDVPLETLFVGWRWVDSTTSGHWPLHSRDVSGQIQTLMWWIHELFPPAQPGDEHMIAVLLDAILFQVERAGRQPRQEMVARVKAHIQRHLAETLTLDALADAAGSSKYHFCRAFKEASGMTPMQYVRQVRVEAARSLLLSTPWTLKAIAEQVGFADEFQLSRVFRRVTGVSPSHLRHKG